MPFLHILEPRYPAAFTVHWTTGPTPCCVKHARALINLGRMLGTHVPATAAAEGAECENCINEAKAAAASDGVPASDHQPFDKKDSDVS